MNVPRLRFKEFSGEWEEKKLGDVADLTSSKRVYLSDYVNEGIPFYRGKEISELKRNEKPKDILYITRKAYETFKAGFGVPQVNDILITAVGTLGNVYRIKNDSEFYFKDGNLIWLKNVIISSAFLEILLEINHDEIQKSSIGSTQRALTIVELKKLKFNVPSLPEQTKIANFLTAIDAKIANLTQKHELLARYKKGVMQQIFGKQLRFKDDDGLEFPEWEVKELGKVTGIIMGQSPDSKSYNDIAEGKPLIQGNADISNRKTSPRMWTSEPTKECKTNDIILTVRAPVGAVAKSYHNACIGRGVCAIRNNDKSTIDFIYQLLLWFEPTKWVSLEQGSTFTAVNSNDIRTLIIPVPSIKEQTKIANFLTALDDKLTNTKNQLDVMKQYKQGLLQQLFV